MELRDGYKQTEVGVIPEDWVVKPIGKVAEVIGGGDSKYHSPYILEWRYKLVYPYRSKER